MEKRSEKAGHEPNSVRTGVCESRLTADEIVSGKRRRDFGPYGRQKGTRPGYYRVICTWCQGFGLRRIGQNPVDTCAHCDGSGILEVLGERKTDQQERKSRHLLYAGIGLLVTAILLAFVIFRR